MRVATPRVRVIVVLAALLIAPAVSAEAAGPAAAVHPLGGGSPLALRNTFRGPAVGLVNSQVLVALQAVTGQNQCISFTYDLNGNITAKGNLGFGATATWGSSTFGCFSWTAP